MISLSNISTALNLRSYFSIRRNPERSKPMRKDVHTIILQPNVEFDTYWKDTGKVGAGPTVAIYAYEIEILRFDCFGALKGHYHVFSDLCNKQSDEHRISFKETTREEQIDRTIWEIENNLLSLIRLIANNRIRSIEIDRNSLKNIIPQLKKSLEKQHERVSSHLKQKKDDIKNNTI